MIKEVIFDFGNVICSFTNDHLIERISQLNGQSTDQVYQSIYQNSDITKRFESGQINGPQFHQELSKICHLSVSCDELEKIYTLDKFTPIPGMEDLINSLKGKYKIGLLSNTSKWDYDYFLKVAPIVKTFDYLTTSFEAGATKPSPIIFQDAIKKSGFNPEECLYTDDIADYVSAAKDNGLNAVQFTTSQNFRIDLEKLKII